MSFITILTAILGPFIYICLLTGLFIYLFRKKLNFQAALPLALISTTLFVYVFTLVFDNISIGFWFSVLGAAMFIPLVIRDKDGSGVLKELFFTPGFVLFCILYLFIVALSWFKVVPLLSDTSMHWAPHVWTMWLRDDFYTSPGLSIVNNGIYPPATQLFELLFLRAANVYHEGLLFIAIQILGLSMLIPVSQNLTWLRGKNLRQLGMVGLLAITIVLLPLVFFVSDFYFSLEVDAILGIIFAYCAYLAIKQSRKFSVSGLAQLSLAVSFLCLTKQIAILLAALVALIYLTGLFITYKSKIGIKVIARYFKDWKAHWVTIVTVVGLALLPLALTTAWSLQVSGYRQPDPGIAIFSLKPTDPLQIPAILAGDEGSEAQQHFSRAFIRHVLVDPGGFVLNYLNAASYMQVVVLFIGIMGILWIVAKSKKERLRVGVNTFILTTGWFFYCFAIYNVFLFGGMKPVELLGKDVSNRYLRTYLLGILLVGALLLLRRVVDDYQSSKRPRSFVYFITVLIITFGLLFNTGTFAVLGLQSISQRGDEFTSLGTNETKQNLRKLAGSNPSDERFREPDKIVITAKSDAERHYLQYAALPNRVSLILIEEGQRTATICKKINNSDYLVVGYANPAQKYEDVVSSCTGSSVNLETGKMFRVDRLNGTTILNEL